MKIIEEKGRQKIFDVIRKKYVLLTPEEWVRQHFIHYMFSLEYPGSLMAVEKLVIVNHLRQRADVVLFNHKGHPAMIVECKAPSVALTNYTLQQAARYNIPLGVKYLVITNGLNHYCIEINSKSGEFKVVESMPDMAAIDDSTVK